MSNAAQEALKRDIEAKLAAIKEFEQQIVDARNEIKKSAKAMRLLVDKKICVGARVVDSGEFSGKITNIKDGIAIITNSEGGVSVGLHLRPIAV